MVQLYRKESLIAGTGLFTRARISAGTVVLSITGRLVATDELSDECIRRGLLQGISPGWALVSADGARSDFSYVNHAADCNCEVDITSRQLVSLRDIDPDEELTVDYRKEPLDERVRRIVNATLGLTPSGDFVNGSFSAG